MRKLLCLILLLSVFIKVHAASAKIAIVSDSPEADKVATLALAELSAKDNITVLERGEIDKLLKEHKLSHSGMTAAELSQFARIAHVDVFAIINSAKDAKKTVVSSLLVFDAKSGFKLRDIRLAGRFEHNVKSTTAAIEAALDQLREPQKLSYVAVLAVRNAGVPAKYKYQLENIAEEVQRRLVATPDIAVLERSRLGLVNKERKLTGIQYKLLPSAYLLDFEFSQGASADIANLKLYIFDVAGRQLEEYSFPAAAVDPTVTVQKIMKKLAVFFMKDQLAVPIASAKKEAAGYYQEFLFYTSQRDFRQAFPRLEAAMALDPGGIQAMSRYGQALYDYVNALEYRSCQDKIDQQLEAMRMLINHGDYLRQRFPSYSNNAYNYSTLFFSPMAGDYSQLSVEQKQRAHDLYNELRPKYLAEGDRLEGGYPLNKPVRTTRQLKQYLGSTQRSCNHYLFFYYDEAVKHYFKLMPKLLRIYAKFSSYSNCPVFPLIYFTEGSPRFTAALVSQLQGPAASATIDACKNCSQENIRELGLMWEFLRSCAKTNFDKKQLKSNLDKYLPLIKSKPLKDYIRAVLSYNPSPDTYKIYQNKTMEVKAHKASSGSWEKLQPKLLFLKEPAEIAKNIIRYQNVLSQWRLARTDTDEGLAGSPAHTLLRMARILTPPVSPETRQALAILNRPLTVTEIKKIPECKGNIMQHAVEYRGNIYLLIQDIKRLRILSFNPESAAFKELFKAHTKTVEQYQRDYNTFFVNNDYFIFIYGGKIAVVTRNTRSMKLIDDLPEPEIYALAMLNGRIYAVAGDKYQGRILFSCNLDGSNRETIVSILRRDKRNPLDYGKILDVGGMFADESGQRILLVTGGCDIAGLWSFSPGDRKVSRLVQVPGGGEPGAFALRRGNVIYFSNGRALCKFFTFNIKSGHSVFLYAFSYSYCPPEHRYWRNFAIKPEYNGPLNSHHRRFFSSHGLLWFDGYRTAMADLKAGNGLYRIYGLTNLYNPVSIFPCPGSRDVYAIGCVSIYRITPPPENGVKEVK